jgi:hypothetical protein
MSSNLLQTLSRIARQTRRLAQGDDGTGAIYPRDYHRPAALLARRLAR